MTDDTTSSADERDDVESADPQDADPQGADPQDADPQDADPQGEALAGSLSSPGDYQVAADETEAEELDERDTPVVDDTPDRGDPADVVIDDQSQLSAAESVAAAARSSRPVRRKADPGVALTPKKATATAKRTAGSVAERQRTTPPMFVNQSAAELRKVLWPTGDQLRQYFAVVLVFVLIIIAYVGLLDFGLGWALIKLFGAK